ncbi:MAG: hypothetical protein PHW53_01215 [Patescibacteria group bacterium]|nr:hypothetical protein [Patescibacteria group bacterium]
MANQTDNKIMSVPEQIFDQFLTELGEQKIPEEVIARLRKTLVDNGQISVDALKQALFYSDSTDV